MIGRRLPGMKMEGERAQAKSKRHDAVRALETL